MVGDFEGEKDLVGALLVGLKEGDLLGDFVGGFFLNNVGDGATVLGLKLGALPGEKVGETDLLGAVVLGLQLGDLLGGIVVDDLGDNVGKGAVVILL